MRERGGKLFRLNYLREGKRGFKVIKESFVGK